MPEKVRQRQQQRDYARTASLYWSYRIRQKLASISRSDRRQDIGYTLERSEVRTWQDKDRKTARSVASALAAGAGIRQTSADIQTRRIRGENVADKYVVTGYVKRIGRRDRISKEMTHAKAKDFKEHLLAEMKIAILKYKWVKELKIEKA